MVEKQDPFYGEDSGQDPHYGEEGDLGVAEESREPDESMAAPDPRETGRDVAENTDGEESPKGPGG